MATPYVPLWCLTNHSFLLAASHPDELVAQAVDFDLPAIAVTDLDSLGGIVSAHSEACTRGVSRLIVGAELTVADEAGDRCSVVVLVATREGYAQLSSTITTGRLRSPKGVSRVTGHECLNLAAHPGTLVLWTERSGSQQLLASLAPVTAGRLYVGVSRHARAEDERLEAALIDLAERYDLPVIALPRVLYHTPQRRRLHDVLTCIRYRETLDTAGSLLMPNDRFALPSPAEMAERYADHPEWLERTCEIADRCRFSLAEIEYRYPSEERPDGFTDTGWLRELTQRGALDRYPEGTPPEVARQLTRELDLIEELNYAGYFLTMAEIVRWCGEQGILCQGRGSAANSSVCYCLGITAVDPVRMNLLFERFLSRERAEPPDIDLDIEHRRREEVIAHVYDHYGREYAAMVANIVRFRRRSAVREVGLVFGFADTTIDQLSKILSQRGLPIRTAVNDTMLDPSTTSVAAFIEVAEEILDTPRHLSIHPGGFLLGREPVRSIVPIEHATMPGRTVVQWDKYAIEEMNLFKVDLLGLGALTHIDFATQLLERHLGTTLHLRTIPAHCPQTFAMLQRGDTVGVFQLESRAQMSMLPRLKPNRFYDLVVEISIVRPGPITGGMVHPYLRRRNGEEPVVYPHHDLAPVLERTLGVPLFQEQVMKLAVVAADYTPGEADQLRRDMAAWRRTGRIEQHRKRIIERMAARGIERTFAERVFEQIRGFGEYGFPESHAASFALIAWATAWLRAHYPAVFTCALLNAWPMGFYSPATIIGDARRHGVEVLPIDALVSSWDCTLEPSDSESGRSDKDGHLTVRIGLRYVRAISREEAERLITVRESAALQSSTDHPPAARLRSLLADSRLERDTALTMARAGAFSRLGISRRDAAWVVMGRTPSSRPTDHGAPAQRVGDLERLLADWNERPARFRSLDSFEEVAWDYAATGQSTRSHPLEPFRTWLRDHAYPAADDLTRLPTGRNVSYIGMVICRQRPETASGTLFMTLEDETGFVNLIVWKRRFEEFRTVLVTGAFLGVAGILQSEHGITHLVVDRAWHPELPRSPTGSTSRDFH